MLIIYPHTLELNELRLVPSAIRHIHIFQKEVTGKRNHYTLTEMIKKIPINLCFKIHMKLR